MKDYELKVLASIDKMLVSCSSCPGWHSLRQPEYRTALVMAACHESWLGKVNKQIKGPALSAFMIEPATWRDLQVSVIQPNKYLRRLQAALFGPVSPDMLLKSTDYAAFCACLCIGRYRKVAPMPKDPAKIAAWLKRRYNSAGGKATAQEYLRDYNRLYANRTDK